MATFPTQGEQPYGAKMKAYVDAGDSGNVPKTLVDAKGDLLVGTANDTVGRLPVGADGQIVVADSAQPTGLRWGGSLLQAVSIERNGASLRISRPDQAVDARWWEHFVDPTGFLPVRATSDIGAAQKNVIQLWRSGEVRLDGIQHSKGTGSPEGVVGAPVGSRYVDTAATNGAVEWVKASGASSTGWKVVYGDTGWRNIGASLLNGWTASSALLSRTGNRVSLRLFDVNGAASTGGTIITLPAAFWPSAWSLHTGFNVTGSYATIPFRVDSGGNVIPMAYATTIRLGAEVSWRTDAAWPTTLPGVAA